MKFAVLGEKAVGQRLSVKYGKLSAQHTEYFPTGQLKWSKISPSGFSQSSSEFVVWGLTSRGERKQTLQFPVPWSRLLWKPLKNTTVWTPVNPHFTLLHPCPYKPSILQQATTEGGYLHSPSTAVSTYLIAHAAKSPYFCLGINLLDIWFSNPLFPMQLTAF